MSARSRTASPGAKAGAKSVSKPLAAAPIKPPEPPKKTGLAAWFDGFAGSVNGSFFQAPNWVDKSKPAGLTSLETAVKGNPKIKNYLNCSFIVFSPNLVWLSVALVDYFVFPYELEASKVFTMPWIAWRMFANAVLVFGYVGFWHVSLYLLQWGKRPFNANRKYRIEKVLHNMFYNALAVLQWTVWEAIFCYCFATGRLPYVKDEESFGSYWGLARFAAVCWGVALWRDLHFYWAHRFLHPKFLFKYVHSLHHRNTDIEPFAGLCMHPIEHLFYYSCAGPALYFCASPFFVMWFGIHLLISPAASHSGYEDNMQSDAYHYLHHRFCECNYGTPGVPYDAWFGTFRESLNVNSKTYKGEHVESKDVKLDASSIALADTKATLRGLPTWDSAAYNIVSYMLIPALIYFSLNQMYDVHTWQVAGVLSNAQLLALAMAVGPLIMGFLCLAASTRNAFSRPRQTFLYPFHKEAIFGKQGMQFALQALVCVMPVYHMIHMLLSEPGQGAYFWLHGQK